MRCLDLTRTRMTNNSDRAAAYFMRSKYSSLNHVCVCVAVRKMQRIIKPKNQRVKRALEERAPKLVENEKSAMFIRGGKTSETVTQVLKDLYAFKKPEAVLFQRKNVLKPFEDTSSVEFFSQKNDASLFMLGSHSKKRPHNLVVGRFYDHRLLDMIELGIEKYQSRQKFMGVEGSSVCAKPCLIFTGDLFETDLNYIRLKNMFIDFFHGPDLSQIRLAGLEHVMSFTVSEGKIYFRVYKILLKKSGSHLPRVELEEMGPSLDLVMRRTQLASDEMMKQACRKPKATKPKKVKNISHDAFGSKLGRVHMMRQDFSKFQTRKIKGLKRSHDQRDRPDVSIESRKKPKVV